MIEYRYEYIDTANMRSKIKHLIHKPDIENFFQLMSGALSKTMAKRRLPSFEYFPS